ncbi:MAG: B12-binding domain-containing protein [Planctomycetota bacterium]
MEKSYVSTARAAQALGVSVSTVKRWVDEGILPADKTPGGHRKLLVSDVVRVARDNTLPHVDLTLLQNGKSGGGRTAETREVAARLYRNLKDFDEESVRQIVLATYRQGTPMATIADEIIAPVMSKVGHDWEIGRMDVYEEHRATQLLAGALFELKAHLEASSRGRRPIAIGGAYEGDYYLLPSLLAQMVLIDLGWNAINLGPNTPLASLRKALRDHKPSLIWLSLSYMTDPDSFKREYLEFHAEADRDSIAVILGGQALGPELRASIPYTAYGDGLQTLGSFAKSLHPIPRRPKRGRPAADADG